MEGDKNGRGIGAVGEDPVFLREAKTSLPWGRSGLKSHLWFLAMLGFLGKIRADQPCHQHGNIELPYNRLQIGDGTDKRLNGDDVAIA